MLCRLLPLPLLWASFAVAVSGETSSAACETSLLQSSVGSADPCSCMATCLSKGESEAICQKACEQVAACVADGVKTCKICEAEVFEIFTDYVSASLKACLLAGTPINKCLVEAAEAFGVGPAPDDDEPPTTDADPCSCMATCLSKGESEAVCKKGCEAVTACVADGVKTCKICEAEVLEIFIDYASASLKACLLGGTPINKCLVEAAGAFGVGPPGDAEPQTTMAPPFGKY